VKHEVLVSCEGVFAQVAIETIFCMGILHVACQGNFPWKFFITCFTLPF
jgi:hypothetical protein